MWSIPVTDEDVKSLLCLSSLKDFRLALTGVSDKIVGVLVNFKNLETIDLNGGILSDSSLADLLTLPHLKKVDVDYCPKDDELIEQLGTRHIDIRCNDLLERLGEIGKRSSGSR